MLMESISNAAKGDVRNYDECARLWSTHREARLNRDALPDVLLWRFPRGVAPFPHAGGSFHASNAPSYARPTGPERFRHRPRLYGHVGLLRSGRSHDEPRRA